MEKKQKRGIILGITMLTLVTLILLGLTYAYYRTRIVGNTKEKSIIVSSKTLEITYEDGTSYFQGESVEDGVTLRMSPGDVIEKHFSVTNTGDDTVLNYGIVLEELVNTFSRSATDLQLVLTCESILGNECNGLGEDEFISVPKLSEVLAINSIEKDETHSYVLKITYLNKEEDQSIDMGMQLEGKVNIIDAANTVDIEGTLASVNEGDYVQINSEPITSKIVNGKYKLVGVEPGSHTLTVRYKDENGVEQIRGSYAVEIIKDEVYGVSDNSITINDYVRTANISIDSSYQFSINESLKGYAPVGKTSLADVVSVGDYVNYEYLNDGETSRIYTTPEESSGNSVDDVTQTFDSASDSRITSWRVFSNQNGVVQLLADIPADVKLTMNGTNAWLNGPTVLDELSKTLYSSTYGTARNINIDDINTATGIDLTGKYYYFDATYTKQFIQSPQTIGELENTVAGLPTLNGDIVLGKNSIQDLVINAYTYSYLDMGYTNSALTDATSYRNNPVWDMISTGTATTQNPYWVASTCLHPDYDSTATDGSYSPRVIYRHFFVSSGSISIRHMADSVGDEVSDRLYSIRPIVTLSQNVYVNSEKTNDVWIIE